MPGRANQGWVSGPHWHRSDRRKCHCCQCLPRRRTYGWGLLPAKLARVPLGKANQGQESGPPQARYCRPKCRCYPCLLLGELSRDDDRDGSRPESRWEGRAWNRLQGAIDTDSVTRNVLAAKVYHVEVGSRRVRCYRNRPDSRPAKGEPETGTRDPLEPMPKTERFLLAELAT